MTLFEKHQSILENAVKAVFARTFFAQYPEHPGAYGPDAPGVGQTAYQNALNKPFEGLLQTGSNGVIGEEVSPYTGQALGITYPTAPPAVLVENAKKAAEQWQNTDVQTRAGLLIESLEQIKNRFFELAHATQHTTGQSFMMSFQASGPHALDRALETIAMGYAELTRFPENIVWDKPMGKFNLVLNKSFKAISKGIGLVIGCSTFPTWNTLPGLYANLIIGNTVIVKPHPGAIMPIAIVVAELQKTLQNANFDANIVQLASDESKHPITTELAQHPDINLIDYTGGSAYGRFLEAIPNKTIFTEKSGINAVIIDSAHDLREVMRNIAFSVSLYSGQMCTAPQNIFIPANGIAIADGEVVSYAQAVDLLKNEIASLVLNPKAGPGTLGAIQNQNTLQRAQQAGNLGATVALAPPAVTNPEFTNARICAPTLLEVSAEATEIYQQELFGPIVIVVRTSSTAESVAIAADMVKQYGAITCSVYCTNAEKSQQITDTLNRVFAPVSLNLVGAAFVNQHAAFSDFHVTGGNPAGNASFTDGNFITRRFVWVGNRSPK